MNDQDRQLIDEFMIYEKRRGYKDMLKIPPILKAFCAYLEETGLSLLTVRHRHAQDYQTWLSSQTKEDGHSRYASITIAGYIIVAKNLYTFLSRKKYIPSNPFTGIQRLKQEWVLPRNLPDIQAMKQFLDSFRDYWKEPTFTRQRALYKMHVVAEVMYATGMRIGEAANLRVEDIDFIRGCITIRESKTGVERTAYLNEYASKVLYLFVHEMREYVLYKPDSPLLFGINGKNPARLLREPVNIWLAEIGEMLGIHDFTSHCFRHTLGYHLLQKSCDMRYIQLILGHEKLGSTVRYTRVNKENLKNELDRFYPRRFRSKEDEQE